jgi:hypothetical protein
MTPAAYGNRSTGSVADCRESGSMGRTAAAAIGVASLPAGHGRLHPPLAMYVALRPLRNEKGAR